jgi:hypothetical protein
MGGFEQDTALAEVVPPQYGKYVATFRSATGQAVVHLFENNGWLVAHVGMPTGLEADEVTDPLWDELAEFARARGFEKKLRYVIAERAPRDM